MAEGRVRGGSWEALSFFRMHWDMNPPPTPPEEGSQCRARLPSSPPGRGQGWVGSWEALLQKAVPLPNFVIA